MDDLYVFVVCFVVNFVESFIIFLDVTLVVNVFLGGLNGFVLLFSKTTLSSKLSSIVAQVVRTNKSIKNTFFILFELFYFLLFIKCFYYLFLFFLLKDKIK